MKLTTVLFLIGLITICSALNARTYQKYVTMFNKQTENIVFLEKSQKKQDVSTSSTTLTDPASVLAALESSKYKFTSKVHVQKSEYLEAYQNCLETVQNFDCHLEKDWQEESQRLGQSNQNISEIVKVNEETLKSYTENISRIESNYSNFQTESNTKLDKFKSDLLAIESVLAYTKNVHVPESSIFLEKGKIVKSEEESSSLSNLGSKIYETADYLTHPVGNVLLKFANIFLQTHQEETSGSASTEEAPQKPSARNLTSVLEKIQNLLTKLKQKVVEEVNQLEKSIASAKSERQVLVDENTSLIANLDILNKRLVSQATEQQKLIDEYQSNLGRCNDIALQKANCEDIKQAGEATLDDYKSASELVSQAEEELAKLISAANANQSTTSSGSK